MKQNSNSKSGPQDTSLKKGNLNNNKPRPEIRDNLDSREGEEQQSKGTDITHNKKETKENHLKETKKSN